MVNVLVSACLLGENCKYSGGSNHSEELIDFLKAEEGRIQVIPVCPEVMGGLTTPRLPSEIRETDEGKKVVNKAGEDVTESFLEGAREVLKIALESQCHFAILKERSPSCGSAHIYDGSFTGTVIKGMGLTAQLLADNGVEVFSEENLGKY